MDDTHHAAMNLFQHSNLFASGNVADIVATPSAEELEAEQDAIRFEKELAQMLQTEFDCDDIVCDVGDESDYTATSAAAIDFTTNDFHSPKIDGIATTPTIRSNSRINHTAEQQLNGCNSRLYENKPNEKRDGETNRNSDHIDTTNYDDVSCRPPRSTRNVIMATTTAVNTIDDIDANIRSRQRQHSNVLSSSKNDSTTSSPITAAELEKLKVQYDVRMREIENLRSEKCDLFEALNRAKMETQQAIVSRDEIQKMLVEATGRITNTEKELSICRQKCCTLEQVNNNTLHELEMCKSTIKELEQRLLVAEKNGYKSHEKNFDNLLKNLTSEHKRQLSSLQNELHLSNNKLTAKEIDLAKLEQRLLDLRTLHESTLNEKTNIINKLNSELEKLKCWFDRHSSCVCDSSGDKDELQRQIEQKTEENDRLKNEVVELQQRLSSQLKRVANLNDAKKYSTSNENGTRTSDGLSPPPSPSSSFSPFVSNTKMKLTEELRDAVKSVEGKRAEIRSLQEKLCASSERIKCLENGETKFLSEIESLKKEKEKLVGELKECEHQRETLKIGLTDYAAKMDVLHQEQLSALQLAFSKHIVELETQIATCESRIQQDASKIFAEEIDRIANVYSHYFDNMTRSMERLKMQIVNQSTRLEQASQNADKLRTQIEKIYQKYTNARKIALQLKQLTEDRDRIAKRQREQYIQTLNEIQRYLDNALTNVGIFSTGISSIANAANAATANVAVTNNADTVKLAELIEKSKNTVRLDEPSINDQLYDLTRRLSNLEK